MGYKCGCGAEFDNQKDLVSHMVNVHSSPFVSGEEKLIAMSIKIAKETKNENVLRKLREQDILDENNNRVVY
jgi:hypothetical protein